MGRFHLQPFGNNRVLSHHTSLAAAKNAAVRLVAKNSRRQVDVVERKATGDYIHGVVGVEDGDITWMPLRIWID